MGIWPALLGGAIPSAIHKRCARMGGEGSWNITRWRAGRNGRLGKGAREAPGFSPPAVLHRGPLQEFCLVFVLVVIAIAGALLGCCRLAEPRQLAAAGVSYSLRLATEVSAAWLQGEPTVFFSCWLSETLLLKALRSLPGSACMLHYKPAALLQTTTAK